MSLSSCLVVPPLVLTPDDLCLSTDTDQDGSAGPLERGDHRISLRNRHIQPHPARHTMQFHVHHVIGAGLFLGAHGHPLSLRCTPPESRFQGPSSTAKIQKTTTSGFLASFPPGWKERRSSNAQARLDR